MMELGIPSLDERVFDDVPLLTDDALFDECGVRLGFTGRAGGVSTGAFSALNTASHVGDGLEDVMENRGRVMDAIGAGGMPLVVPCQVHGTNIVYLGDAACAREAQVAADGGADAVVVTARRVAVLLNFADCLPLVLVAPTGAFAVVHAGWRGAVAHIAAASARGLATASGCPPSTFNAYIGPHIRRECFEVGPEVASEFVREFGRDAVMGERHVDLAAAVTADLRDAGVRTQRVADAGICTVCACDRYFSYRASGGTCGRHAAVAVCR